MHCPYLFEKTAISSLNDSELYTSPPATPGSLCVQFTNSQFSKISARRVNKGCLKHNKHFSNNETHVSSSSNGQTLFAEHSLFFCLTDVFYSLYFPIQPMTPHCSTIFMMYIFVMKTSQLSRSRNFCLLAVVFCL